MSLKKVELGATLFPKGKPSPANRVFHNERWLAVTALVKTQRKAGHRFTPRRFAVAL